jgi:hypothetical protein
MADEGEREKPQPAPAKASPRLPYSPPEIWEEPLEDRPHLLAACAQREGQDEVCNASPWS